jgi:hypothetical protein
MSTLIYCLFRGDNKQSKGKFQDYSSLIDELFRIMLCCEDHLQYEKAWLNRNAIKGELVLISHYLNLMINNLI